MPGGHSTQYDWAGRGLYVPTGQAVQFVRVLKKPAVQFRHCRAPVVGEYVPLWQK